LVVTSAGEYYATVTDGNNCQKVVNINIEEEFPPEISIENIITPNPCFGELGSIAFESSPWLYSIDFGQSWFSDSIIIENPGEYALSLASRDTSCIWWEVQQIDIGEIPFVSIESIEKSHNTNCINANGKIEIIPSPGLINDLLFSINGGQTFSPEPIFDGLSEGVYYPAIRSNNGSCLVFYPDSIPIIDPPEIEYSLEILQPISCENAENGSLSIVTNETSKFVWSTSETTPLIENLASGYYGVTIEDGYQCIIEDEIYLEEGPVLDTWLFPKDTLICTGDTFWVELPQFAFEPFFAGNADFIEEDGLLGFYNHGVYSVSFYVNESCFHEDELLIEEEAQDFSGVDFLISEEGLVGEPITAIDITWPLTDLSEWVVLDSNITIIEQIENQLILSFSVAGVYKIGLSNSLGNCSYSLAKTITIYDDPSQLQNQENHLPSDQKVIDFSLFPNPNNGSFRSKIILSQKSDVLLFIVDHMGNRISEISGTGENSYITNFDLENNPPGIYALILLTQNQERYILFNKI
jgi:hypothetical protein